MPSYQGDDEGGGGAAEIDKTGANFCPHCGSVLDEGDKKPTPPPYQLSKFSPQDRGFGNLAQSAQGAAGDILSAARRSAASE